jgi:hypothetical protein
MTTGDEQQMIAGLLRTAQTVAQAGNTAAAKAVLHALTAQFPGEPEGWLALAELSADPSEERAALERVLALAPDNPQASSRLAALAAVASAIPDTAPPPQDAPAAPVLVAKSETAELLAAEPEAENLAATSTAAPRRVLPPAAIWALLAVLAVLIVVLVAALFWWPGDEAATPKPEYPAIGATTAPLPTEAAPLPTEAAPLPTDAAPQPTDVPLPTAFPTLSATAAPTINPAPALALGAFLQQDTWTMSLLRPDYALALSGAIGDLQPQGRFVLALVSLANSGSQAQVLPPGTLVLRDNQGRTYAPRPNASSVYLAAYGRGQRGDLSLEDAIPPGGSFFSVPVIFDLPQDAKGLVLTFSSAPQGWPISL